MLTLSPADGPDDAFQARNARHLAVLEELSGIGMEFARALGSRVREEPKEAERLGLAYARVARGVREAIGLEARLDRERRNVAEEAAQAAAAEEEFDDEDGDEADNADEVPIRRPAPVFSPAYDAELAVHYRAAKALLDRAFHPKELNELRNAAYKAGPEAHALGLVMFRLQDRFEEDITAAEREEAIEDMGAVVERVCRLLGRDFHPEELDLRVPENPDPRVDDLVRRYGTPATCRPPSRIPPRPILRPELMLDGSQPWPFMGGTGPP